MNKVKNLKINQLDPELISIDVEKSNKINQSITNNNMSNNDSINTIENKPSIKKTKSKLNSPTAIKGQNTNKKKNSPNKNKKIANKNNKKVKFIEKIDIIKIECWKKYNLEQTADECDFFDNYLEDFENPNDEKKETNTNKNKNSNKNKNNNNKNNNSKKNKNNLNNNRNKGKKGNFTCVCIII